MKPEFINIFWAMGRGFLPWWPAFFGALFLLGTVVVYIRRETVMYDRSPGGRIAVCVVMAVLSAILCFGSGTKVYLEKQAVEEALRTKTYKIVDGIAVKVKPPFKGGEIYERFCVIDQCFYYSDYIPTFGFNDTKVGGGPIRENLHVQVTYVGNVIIRLDILPPPKRLPGQP